MKCPKCIEEGKKSVVTRGASMQQAIYIPMQWDEEGRPTHSPKHAETKTGYSCSNGHTWTEVE